MSGVRKHYEKDRSESVCKICGNKTQFTGSTTGMWYHLGQKHGIKKPQDKKETRKSAAKQPPKSQHFFRRSQLLKFFQNWQPWADLVLML